MRTVMILAWKDLRILLTSPLFYVVSGLCAMLWSYSYMRNLLAFAERSRVYMQPGMETGMNLQREVFLMHISQINLLFVFVVPALTMRLLAEEKRMRTYDLLLTSPITPSQITLGKFFAGLGVVSTLTLISFLYPLGTRAVAEFPIAPLLSAYLGVFLISAAYVAIGLFASSLTESVLLSVIMGLIFNILLWFVSQGSGADGGSIVSAVLEYMSIGQHFLGFILGTVKLNSLVFMLSLTALFLFLTRQVVESSRWR
jgi:ABC-2 type transport system permease protein